MGDTRQPLLEVVSGQCDAADSWPEYMDMKALIANEPSKALQFIKEKGMKKLGTFEVQDETILAALAGRTMMTYGSDRPDIDYETVWREQLHKAAPGETSSWGAQVKVSAYVCTIKNAAAPDVDGLLHPLLRRYQAGNLSDKVFTLPAVSSVINFKWDWFAFRLLMWELGFFLTWLLSFNAFVILFQDENPKWTLKELMATTKGLTCIICHGISLVAMLPFLIIEVCTMVAYLGGWFNAWNMLDMATYINQILIVWLHLERSYAGSQILTLAVSLQCVLLWFRLQYFSRVFRPTKFAFLDGLTAVFDQTKWYFFFSMLIMWGFGMAFYTLYRLDQNRTDEFDNIGATLMTMFKWMLGGADLDVVGKSSEPGSTLTLAIVYQFVMCMVLLNVIMGVMMNATEKVDANGTQLYFCSKAQVTDELESTLPAFLERALGCWNPAFVHVLKVDKEENDCLDLLLGEDDQNLVGEVVEEEEETGDDASANAEDVSSKGGKASVDADLVAEVAELKKMVAELTALVKMTSAAGSSSKK